MQIIPAIDIINAKCVRLTEGNYNAITEYKGLPLDIAKRYQDHGITRLHLVDLDGARKGIVQNWKTLEDIAKYTDLTIDFGGGVKRTEDVQRIIDLGVEYVTVGSVAAKDPSLFSSWLEQFTAARFLLGADVKDHRIMVSGWAEKMDVLLIPYLQEYYLKGVTKVFCTDINKDGKLEGPSISLYQDVLSAIPHLELIASGGVSTMSDINELKEIGCSAVIVGKAIYENKISLLELEEFISKTRNQ